MAEIIYGIRGIDGKIISVDEVPDNKPGLACDCVCASCGKDLQACSLKGKVHRYFRHNNDSRTGSKGNVDFNCNPHTANETALHQMAKQIISEEKKIFVPRKNISLHEAGVKDLPDEIRNKIGRYEHQKAMMVVAESVELEKRLENFTPDVTITTKRGELLVEIFVSHRVNGDKKEKTRHYGSAMLEIDLQQFAQTPISSADLREIIIDGVENKKWIYYPLTSEIINKAKNFYEGIQEVKEYRRAVAEELWKKQKEENNKKRRNNKINHLFKPETYAAELRRLRNDASFLEFYKKNGKSYWFPLNQSPSNLTKVPFFVDVPITGEMIFQCDRRIWQTAIFNRYIYSRKEDGASINVENIFDNLRDDFQIIVDFDLSYKLTNPLSEDESIWLRRDVISKYLEYLETIGFIVAPNGKQRRGNGNWRVVKARRTLTPPNENAATQLLAALRRVDLYAPNIDQLIDEEMSGYYEEQRRKEEKIRERVRLDQLQCEQEEKKRRETERKKMEEQREAEQKAARLEQERTRREHQQEMYNVGLHDVESLDFSEEKNRYDRYDRRWAKCVFCNQIKRDDELIDYLYGEGKCRKCRENGNL